MSGDSARGRRRPTPARVVVVGAVGLAATLPISGCLGVVGRVINAAHSMVAVVRHLKDLQSEIRKGENATYVATYKLTGGPNAGGTVTFAQAHGGRFAFMASGSGSSSGIRYSSDGHDMFTCGHGGGAQWSCQEMSGAATAAMAAGAPFYAFTALAQYGLVGALYMSAALTGSSVTSSTTTVAGVALHCAAFTGKVNGVPEHLEWCTTSDGILGLVKNTSSSAGDDLSFQLTSLDRSPSASLFEPPAGATVTKVTTATTSAA